MALHQPRRLQRYHCAISLCIVIMLSVASIIQWEVTLGDLVHKPFAHMSIDGSRYNKEKTHETPSIAFYGYSGLMELTQYTEANRRTPELVLNMKGRPQFVKPSVGYAVSVSVICGVKHPVTGDEKRGRRHPLATQRGSPPIIDSCQDDGVFLRIAERYRGDTKSTGGSSFRVISTTSLARKMCSYVDLFDGTYLVWCPFSLGSECSNMSVSLDFVNFTAYTGIHKPLRNVVWQQAVCRGQQSLCNDEGGLAKTDKTILHRTNLSELQYETAMRNSITWQRHLDGWRARLSWRHGQLFEMNTTSLCKRVKRLGRLIMVGASHMRFKADHIVIQCYAMPKSVDRGHSSITIGNVELMFRRKATNFKHLAKELASRNLTKADVVLIQTGAHNMAFDGLQKTVTAAVPAFSRVLREVRAVSRTRGFRVVCVTSPAYPRRCNERSVRGSRNNFALAAYHSSVTKAIVATGFEIFDEFSAFLPHEEEAVCGACGAHYLCRTLADMGHIWGEMGKTATEILLAYATRKQEDDRQL